MKNINRIRVPKVKYGCGCENVYTRYPMLLLLLSSLGCCLHIPLHSTIYVGTVYVVHNKDLRKSFILTEKEMHFSIAQRFKIK